MNPLFPVLPEELASLTDDELQALIDEHVSAIEGIRANDPNIIGELSGSQIVEGLRAGVEQMRVLRALQDSRAEEMQNFSGTVEELAAEGLTLAGQTAADEGEGEGEGEAEAEAGGEEEVADDGSEAEAVEDEEEAGDGGEEATEADAEPVTASGNGTVTYRRPPAGRRPVRPSTSRGTAGMSV